jgi:hypothetical protein
VSDHTQRPYPVGAPLCWDPVRRFSSPPQNLRPPKQLGGFAPKWKFQFSGQQPAASGRLSSLPQHQPSAKAPVPQHHLRSWSSRHFLGPPLRAPCADPLPASTRAAGARSELHFDDFLFVFSRPPTLHTFLHERGLIPRICCVVVNKVSVCDTPMGTGECCTNNDT